MPLQLKDTPRLTSGLISGANITSDTALTDHLGSSTVPWNNVYARYHTVNFDSTGTTVGYLQGTTVGTTSTVGLTRLSLGNNIASGTASNASGEILIYGTNTGYSKIAQNNNTTSNITLTLPSAGGTFARTADNVASATKVHTALGTTTKAFLLGTSTTPTSTSTAVNTIADTGVYLTTTAGQIQVTGGLITGSTVRSDTAVTDSLGTSAIPWSNAYSKHYYINNDASGTNYGRLFVQTAGTTSAVGNGRITLGNSTASGTANNAQGSICLYGSNTGYTIINPGYNSTNSVTLTLPSATGTIATTANIDSKLESYLPLSAGSGKVVTGDIYVNNNIGIYTKTKAQITGTDGTTVAANTAIKILEYNGSENLHLGRDIYEKKLSTGATYLSGATGMNIRTNSGSIALKPSDTSVLSVSNTEVSAAKVINAKAGIVATTSIFPNADGSVKIGDSTNKFQQVVAKNVHAYGDSDTHYASIRTVTEGTTSAQGVGRLVAGNNTNAGTAGNAKGQVLLYGTNTGYTILSPTNNTTSNVTVELPSVAGKLPIMVTDSDNYWGILPPTGKTDTWLRSPGSGLLPYNKTQASSLGSSSWPFNSIYGKAIYLTNVADGKNYASLRTETVGTTSAVGEGRLTVGNSTASGTAGNSAGKIVVYGSSSGYTAINPGNNTSSNITLTLPSATGTIATTANINDKVASYLPLAGGTMSGNITLNNNIVIRSKTPEAYTNGNTGAAVASGSTVNILQYNASGNCHINSGSYDNYMSTGHTYVNSGNNILYRTRNGGYHSFQIQGSTGDNATVVSFKSDGNTFSKSITASSGIISGGTVRSDTAITDNLGTDAIPWNYMKARYFQVFGAASQQGGMFRVETPGTTSTVGETRLTVGNSTASGTAGNAKGIINIYNDNTGYVQLKTRTSHTNGVVVELPSASGQLPIMVPDSDNYWGILPPSGSESSWLRSPKSGLIPFEKNSEVSSLGSSSWPWYNVCGKNFGMYDKSAQSYGYMKVVTDGTADTQGEARISLGNSIANGAAKNSYGRIALYGTNTGYTMITPGNNSTSNITITLPSSGGTLARTSDNVASATKLNTARNITIGNTSRSFNGTADINWSLANIMQGQGLTAGTACGTLYYNNAGVDNVGRLSCYNSTDYGDYVQLGLYNVANASTSNWCNVCDDMLYTKYKLQIYSGGITLNSAKNSTYYALDVNRACASNSMSGYEYSSARFGCTDNFGGVAAIETKHNGTTMGYLRVLPNDGIQLGSGKKLHIQNSAPTENVATGDVWIDAG